MKTTRLIFASASLLLCSAAVQADSLGVMGAVAVYDNIFKNDQAKLEGMTGDKYVVIANSAGQGMAAMGKGEADVAMVSSDFPELLKSIGEPGKEANYTYTQIAMDAAAFGVNPVNKVKTLTRQQVVDILSGKITNWKEVGGNDAQIAVITTTPKGGPYKAATQKLLDGKDITAPGVKNMKTAAEIVPEAEKTPAALSLAPKSLYKNSKLVLIATDAEAPMPQALVIQGKPTPAYTRLVEAAKKLISSR
jgi:phosphate transport system substrate-binding protein